MNDRRIPRSFHLLLLGITILCLIPRLILGTSQYIEYDGYWHVWIAHQVQWGNFIAEYQANAHPPLYFLLLRLTFWLGHTNLTYRAISILTGAGSVYLLGIIAWRAMRSQVWAALATLAYGLALPSILISEEVRTYMMAAFLVQASFWYYLDLIADGCGPLRSRILFGVLAALACLTEYYALIYVGAALLFALIVQPLRAKDGALRALGRELLTFVLLLALPAWEYIAHFGGQPDAYAHLPEFYFQPDGVESLAGFLLRNLRSEMNLFSPFPISGTGFCAVLALCILAAIVICWLARRWNDGRDIAATAIVILPLAILGAIMFGGVARVYPFGGFLRQQYILFPFFAVCPFLLFDRALAKAPRPSVLVIAALVAAATGYASYRNYEAYPKEREPLMSDQMNRYNRLFPAAPAVFLDQYNLTTFFLHHHNWNWSFVSGLPGSDAVDVYKLARNGRSMMLFRDKNHWNLDLRDPQLYVQMARGMKTWHLPAMTIFCLPNPVPEKARTQAQVAAYRTRAVELSAGQGLCVQRLDLDNYDVYAEFRTAGTCTAPLPAQ